MLKIDVPMAPQATAKSFLEGKEIAQEFGFPLCIRPSYTLGGTGGGFDATGNPTFYFYRENMAPNFSSFISGNFRGVNKINNTTASTFSFDGGDANASLPVGNGFLFFFRGAVR